MDLKVRQMKKLPQWLCPAILVESTGLLQKVLWNFKRLVPGWLFNLLGLRRGCVRVKSSSVNLVHHSIFYPQHLLFNEKFMKYFGTIIFYCLEGIFVSRSLFKSSLTETLYQTKGKNIRDGPLDNSYFHAYISFLQEIFFMLSMLIELC